MLSFGTITLWYVLIGTMLAAVSASCIGTLIVLQKNPLAGDAVAHALLPGLCLGFWVVGQKSSLALSIGAFLAGMLASWVLEKIPQWTKLKRDTATALVLSLFFGVGLLSLTHIQHSGNADQMGLQHFLFGNAASIQAHDVLIFSAIATALLIILTLVFRGFKVLLFDRSFAAAIGWPIAFLDTLLRILFVAAVVVGMHSVGVMLMTAMLVAPPAAARFWTHRLHRMFFISALLAAISSAVGTLLSSHVTRLPTGPCIVLTMASIALLSFFLAPTRGLIARTCAQRRYRKKVVEENVLKLFYTLQEETPHTHPLCSLALLLDRYPLSRTKMLSILRGLAHQKLIHEQSPLAWTLTQTGKQKGQDVLRLHLLWEAYLMRYLRIAPDHVHEDAESIEHLLTPSLRKELEELMERQ